MTELARPEGAVLGQGEAQEWVELGEEGWVAPEPEQVLEENVSASDKARTISSGVLQAILEHFNGQSLD